MKLQFEDSSNKISIALNLFEILKPNKTKNLKIMK